MKYTALILCVFLALATQAQETNMNTSTVLGAGITVGYHFPGGDLAARFGNHNSIGSSVDLIPGTSNIVLGLQGHFFFGRTVKEDPLASLRTTGGLMVGNNNSLADIQLRERGFYVGAMAGKLFSLSEINPRSGIRATIGLGVLQHKIRIQDDPQVPVAALAEDLKKGYDRLTNGLALNEFVGYQFMSRDRAINFYIGLEFTQGFTQSRRDYNYDTGLTDDAKRIDSSWGFRLGWILPFYLKDEGEEFLY